MRAYLPANTLWQHAFTGQKILVSSGATRGRWVDVHAPVGEPAAFVRLDDVTGQPLQELVPFMEAARREGWRSTADPTGPAASL